MTFAFQASRCWILVAMATKYQNLFNTVAPSFFVWSLHKSYTCILQISQNSWISLLSDHFYQSSDLFLICHSCLYRYPYTCYGKMFVTSLTVSFFVLLSWYLQLMKTVIKSHTSSKMGQILLNVLELHAHDCLKKIIYRYNILTSIVKDFVRATAELHKWFYLIEMICSEQ